MSVTRRLAAGAAAGILGLLAVAPPASAAPPVVEWTRPTVADNVIVERDADREEVTITGTITGREDQKIRNVEFALIPEMPAGPDDPCFVDVPNETVILDGNNTEDFALSLAFPCNRAYELEVTIGYEEPSVDVGVVDVPSSATTTASIDFSVAIPPARVEGFEAAYDEASKEVRLSWAPNAEPDLLGYVVERNPPGPSGFGRITPELLPPDQTIFTDPDIGEEHRYQVIAVRRGPRPDSSLQGEASAPLKAGPERTEPTLPDDIPAPNSSPPPTTGGSSDAGNQRAAPSRSPSRPDPNANVFEESLPFDPSQTTLPPPTTTTEPPEDAAVLAEFDDDPTDDRRATLVPVAGGLALVVGAMHLFLLSKRAGEPEDIPVSRV